MKLKVGYSMNEKYYKFKKVLLKKYVVSVLKITLLNKPILEFCTKYFETVHVFLLDG